ncbi:unnamed protein product [Paramecium pentaurelia]|uniref:Transmembrane protein n=1 Tax=Paramecium pentaurelia TaxID=43138 RepID=A0A8S1X306_9CILI|nr:unnamed protein product [Paramecium pentaurelia]
MEPLRNSQVCPTPLVKDQQELLNTIKPSSLNQVNQPAGSENYQSIDIESNQNCSDLLKDQSFIFKKYVGLKALLLYFIQHFIAQMLILSNIFFDKSNIEQGVSTFLIFTYFGIIIMTRFQSLQKVPKSYIIFVIILILEAQIFSQQLEVMNQQISEISPIQIDKDNLILNDVGYQCFILFLETSTLIIYLLRQKEDLKLKNFFIIYGIISIVPLLLSSQFAYISIIIFYRGFALSLTIQQQFKGRFSLKINSIFGMANSLNLGFLIPCNC